MAQNLPWTPWHNVVKLREDVRTGELSLADFAADHFIDREELSYVRVKDLLDLRAAEFRSPSQRIRALAAEGRDRSVRINGLETGLVLDDLEAIVCPALQAVRLPKVESADDLRELDALLTHLEMRADMEPGTVATPLDLETAGAMRNTYDILRASPRATSMMLGCGPGGDAARAVGYQWMKDGTETHYLRSRAVLDARAAGIEYPLVTSWWDIRDLDGLRADASLNRRFGFRGMAVMHPSHVAIVNETFSPNEAELAHARGVIAAVEAAEREGSAAVIYEGLMVDYAMIATARELLALAATIDAAVPGGEK